MIFKHVYWICIRWEVKMVRRVVISAMFPLLAMLQGTARAEDLSDLRASLQGCLDVAMTAASFEKARMGERGTLVLHCSEQQAQKLYASLARRVPERNVTLLNRDKGTERRFGLSSCYQVKEKAGGTPAEEFSCRIAISVGAALLEAF
jgi:hypothetical protein